MIQTILRTAVAAVLFAASTNAQSTGRPTEPRDRPTRSQQEPRPKTGNPSTGGPEVRVGLEPGAKPIGESKTTDHAKGKDGERGEMTAAERAHHFMEKHPEVRARLFAKADGNGDGKLSQAEREQMKQLVMTAMRERKEHAQQQSEERQEKRGERREERRENTGERREEALDQWDLDDNGRITPRERAVREKAKERADRNDDGSVGPRERERAQEAREKKEKKKEGTSGSERTSGTNGTNGTERPRAKEQRIGATGR